MKLHITAFGVVVGLFLGAAVFVADAYSILFGAGKSIGIMQWFVPGFGRTWLGAFIGFMSGFIEGFLIGSAFAWSYNRILRALGKKSPVESPI